MSNYTVFPWMLWNGKYHLGQLLTTASTGYLQWYIYFGFHTPPPHINFFVDVRYWEKLFVGWESGAEGYGSRWCSGFIVLVFDGNSEIGAHVRSNLYYFLVFIKFWMRIRRNKIWSLWIRIFVGDSYIPTPMRYILRTVRLLISFSFPLVEG